MTPAPPSTPKPKTDKTKPERTEKTKKLMRCVGGGLVGGLIGGALSRATGGSDNDVKAAIIAGAAAGCALGWNWTEKDKAAYDAERQDLLDAPTPQTQDWTTPESGAKVTLVTTAPTTETREVEFSHYDNVAAPAAGSRVISRPYRSTAVLRLRSMPDEKTGDIVGRFDLGEVVEVVGATPDNRWAMIGESGVIIGYASMAYLQPLDASQTLRKTTTAKAKADTPPRPPKAKSPAPAPAPLTRGQVQTTKLMASTQCKSLVATSGSQKETKKGCALPGGRWQFA